MTAEEREQVVELLRCAADDWRRSENIYGLTGMYGVEPDASDGDSADDTWRTAWDAIRGIPGPPIGSGPEGYRARLLEAAQRVEEGSWP